MKKVAISFGVFIYALLIGVLLAAIVEIPEGGARMNLMIVGGSTPATTTASADCPTGTYNFAWNGEHSSGTNYACFDSGSTAGAYDANGGTILIAAGYAQSGSYGLQIDDDNEYFSWTNPSTVGTKTIIDDEDFTIYAHMRTAGDIDVSADANFFESYEDSSNYIEMLIRASDDYLKGAARGGGAAAEDANSGADVSDGNWRRIGFSCTTSTGYCYVSIDGGDTWNQSASSDYASFTTGCPAVVIGEQTAGGNAASEIHLDNIYVINSFEAADPMG